MKKRTRKGLYLSLTLLVSFVIWTILVRTVEVRPIGPQASRVGFATLNEWAHNLIGVRLSLYTLTDWLGLVPIGVALGFAALGLTQWIRRKRLLRVDRSLLALGIFFAAVMAVFLFFELVVINYRPVLIDGRLEASYPSSTTLLVASVMPAAAMQWRARIQNRGLRRLVVPATFAFVAFTVIGRLLSGVHWITDIIGGALVSAGLVTMLHTLGHPTR